MRRSSCAVVVALMTFGIGGMASAQSADPPTASSDSTAPAPSPSPSADVAPAPATMAQESGPPATAAPPPATVPAPTASATRDNLTKHRDAQSVIQDGTFFPGTYAARIGDQRVSALAYSGYDSNASQGGVLTSVVEGAIVNRIAIRVGYDYVSTQSGGTLSAGLRFGVLRQELNGIDLGFFVQYKQKGFTESNGEIEMALTLSRRWNHFGLYGNLVYGQGFERQERDGEVRVSGIYTLAKRFNVGFEARSHFDLGDAVGSPLPGSPPEAAFDLLVGPMALISLGPVAFLAEAGYHTLVIDNGDAGDTVSNGAIVLAGIGGAL